MRSFGELEAAIMDQVWRESEPVAVRHVLEALRPQRQLAYTTVMTVMDKLHGKGWLTRERSGTAYLYAASGSREDYSAGLMAGALDTSTDRTATLVHFFTQLDPDEAKALRRAIDSAARPGKRR